MMIHPACREHTCNVRAFRNMTAVMSMILLAPFVAALTCRPLPWFWVFFSGAPPIGYLVLAVLSARRLRALERGWVPW
jgi:hypothetical protein